MQIVDKPKKYMTNGIKLGFYDFERLQIVLFIKKLLWDGREIS